MTRRKLDFRDLSAAAAEAESLRRRGWEKCGRWSLAMACEHLALATDGTIDGFPFMPAWPLRVMGRLVFKRVIFRTRSFRAGIRSPEQMQPRATDEAAAVADFARAVARFKAYTGPLQESPFLGKLDKEEWEQFHCIHAAHHLSFLSPR